MSSLEDVVEKPPMHRQATRGKQPARAELVKKKKLNMPPAHRGVGISFMEPSACQRVSVDWSDDDEDEGETLQQ